MSTSVIPGVVGLRLAAGEVASTSSGRSTTPFPRIEMGSDRKAGNTLKRVRAWLIENAIAEAVARGDKFNRRSFEQARASASPADLDSAELYLFDPAFLKPVPAPFLKPLCAAVPRELAAV